MKDETGQAAQPGGVVTDGKGRPVWCMATACAILENSPAWRGVLARDEFAGRYMLMRPVPGSRTPRLNFKPRPLADTDVSNVVTWFNRHDLPRATRATCADAVNVVAELNSFNPVRQYLEGLEWDGERRLNTWLTTYFGTPATLYAQKVGKAWLVSAVARAFAPGCQVDHVLVLEGRQGVGKSSALRILAGADWFGDNLPDLRNKDASSYLRGKWIVEMAELSAMKRADVEHVKSFITRREEDYRPAYGANEVFEPRRNVIAGSTNQAEYLTDRTGNRRFWPVKVEKIDFEPLNADRDQLWAETVVAFNDGDPWHLPHDIEPLAAAEQDGRRQEDPWLPAAATWLADRSEACTTEFLVSVMQIQRTTQRTADSMRTAAIFRELGWVKDGKITSGEYRNCGRFVLKPADPPPEETML